MRLGPSCRGTQPLFSNSAVHEIDLLRKLGPNIRIVNLIGYTSVATKVPTLIFEYCANGDLLRYLRTQLQNVPYVNVDIALRDLMTFAWQIADGMVQ